MERIGIYGGTFNPPHIGHIQAAKQAVTALGLTKLLVIPDRIAPHKQIPSGSPTPEQRLEMVRIAFRDCPEIEVFYDFTAPKDRLRAVPHATLSIAAKQK